MATKKYVSLSKLSTFLDNLKDIFATKTEVDSKANATHAHAITDVTSLQSTLNGKVSTTTTINGKALTSNITLSASDVNADASGSAASALSSAKTYADGLASGKADKTHTHTFDSLTLTHDHGGAVSSTTTITISPEVENIVINGNTADPFETTLGKTLILSNDDGTTTINGKSVAIKSDEPSVDFHYGKSDALTTQLIADTNSRLTCKSSFRTEGSLAVKTGSVYVDNAKFYCGLNASENSYSLLGVGSDDNTYVGHGAKITILRGSAVKLASSTGQNVTSDRNLKTNIEDIDNKYVEFFNSLRPVTYKYELGNSQRDHVGFIAQEVEEALNSSGLTNQEFGGICIDNVVYCEENSEDKFDDMVHAYNKGLDKIYSLRYEEFIALNTKMIQMLQEENKELKERLYTLESKVG